MLYSNICFQDRGDLSGTIVLWGNGPEKKWSCLLLIPLNTKCIKGEKIEPVGQLNEERLCRDIPWVICPDSDSDFAGKRQTGGSTYIARLKNKLVQTGKLFDLKVTESQAVAFPPKQGHLPVVLEDYEEQTHKCWYRFPGKRILQCTEPHHSETPILGSQGQICIYFHLRYGRAHWFRFVLSASILDENVTEFSRTFLGFRELSNVHHGPATSEYMWNHFKLSFQSLRNALGCLWSLLSLSSWNHCVCFSHTQSLEADGPRLPQLLTGAIQDSSILSTSTFIFMFVASWLQQAPAPPASHSCDSSYSV